MHISLKYHIKKLLIFSFIILIGCQLQEPLKTHGIMYLENRSNKLNIKKSNKNDVIQIMGQPQIIDNSSGDNWMYLERILTKGKYHKLGRHVLKENNILILDFDKFGILTNKQLLTKSDIKKLKFSPKNTANTLSQKSFVQKFLQSVKSKMYSNRKK